MTLLHAAGWVLIVLLAANLLVMLAALLHYRFRPKPAPQVAILWADGAAVIIEMSPRMFPETVRS